MAEITNRAIHYIDLSPRDEVCCICDKTFSLPYWEQSYGIPMYEGLPVPMNWDGEWGGFFACKECHDKYERGELQTWDAWQLGYSQAITALDQANIRIEQLEAAIADLARQYDSMEGVGPLWVYINPPASPTSPHYFLLKSVIESRGVY